MAYFGAPNPRDEPKPAATPSAHHSHHTLPTTAAGAHQELHLRSRRPDALRGAPLIANIMGVRYLRARQGPKKFMGEIDHNGSLS